MPITSCVQETTMSAYIPHMNSVQSTIFPQALLYMHFTLTYVLSRYAYHIDYVSIIVLLLWYTYRLHITAYANKTSNPIGFKLSSYVHIYNAFGNHIYSLSSMATYVFIIWLTYFVLCITAKNFGNFTHMCIVPIKCKVDGLNI